MSLTEKELLRFSELKAAGIVADRATLRRRIANDGFPEPLILSANAVAWRASEVRAWLDTRARGSAPQPRRAA